MQPPNRLAPHEARLVAQRERLVRTLGVHTARVLLDRALWQTAQRHPDVALIHHDESGLSFDALEMSYATRPQEVEGYGTRPLEEIEAALTDLSAEMLLILARLLGGEMARRMGTGHPGSRQMGAYWG
jgi:non-ribosomal peptide synthetase component E (peptide arylation enzyme)